VKDLIHDDDFKKRVESIIEECGAMGNSVSIIVLDRQGTESYLAQDASGDDVAFMAAEMLFGYSRHVAQGTDLSVAKVAQMSHKELTAYLTSMIERENSQIDLLKNPVGEA